jgi:hypothetical protein
VLCVPTLQDALMKASDGGKIPIVCDTSPCLSTLKGALQTPDLKCAPPCTRQLPSSSTTALALHLLLCFKTKGRRRAALLPSIPCLLSFCRLVLTDERRVCRFALYEPVQFIKLFLADKLEFSKVRDSCMLTGAVCLQTAYAPMVSRRPPACHAAAR